MKLRQKFISVLVFFMASLLVGLSGLFLYLNPQIPDASTYQNVQIETPLRVLGQNGLLLAEFGERRSIPITLNEVPQHFIDALINTEDKRFYEHRGIDFISLSNDLLSLVGDLITDRGLGSGASTITMQLARNISFNLERRFLRKFKEMLLALKIERELTKNEILTLYINLVPFGKRAYGAEAAAKTYYGKSLDELNLAQLAMLAGIPQRPSAGNPINGPERALKRRNLVLALMLEQTSISEEEYRRAVAAPITAKVYDRELDLESPYPSEIARRQALASIPDLYTGGYKIITTIDENLQNASIQALKKGLYSYDKKHGYRPIGNIEQIGGAKIQEAKVLRSEMSDYASLLQIASISSNKENLSSLEIPEIKLSEESVKIIKSNLESLPIYDDLQAAIAVFVDNEYALMYSSNGKIQVIEKSQSLWARRYIDEDTLGPRISGMKTILQNGDIAYITKQKSGWSLAQIPLIEGASVSIDTDTGRIKAIVGGFDFYRNQYNHATQAKRQPGSGFKPFIYSAAINQGIMPSDIFIDAPLVFEDSNLETQYRPNNDNKKYNGPTRLRQALYRSINLVSMRVLMKVGAGRALDYIPRFGFETKNFPRNTQLAIGGGTMGVTPLEMVRAYAVIANGGFLVEPHVIDKILDPQDNIVFQTNHPKVCHNCKDNEGNNSSLIATSLKPASEELSSEDTFTNEPLQSIDLADDERATAVRVIDERNAYIMDSMLKDVIKLGTGRRALALKRNDLAGKTGTTNDAADTWFNGYGAGIATTVWVGFTNHAPMGSNAYGSNIPLPIWIDIMKFALKDKKEKTAVQPTGIISLRIDPETGLPTSEKAKSTTFDYFYTEHAPLLDAKPTASERTERSKIEAADLF